MRQDGHAEANPDLLGYLAQCAHQDLWAGRAGEARKEVVLHEPEVVEANLVGQFALLQGLLIQGIPVDFGALEGTLCLVKQAALQVIAPNCIIVLARRCRHYTRYGVGYLSNYLKKADALLPPIV